jgi:hypothetical protein
MPLYTFLNNITDEEEDHMMKIAEKSQFLEDNPNLTSRITAPRIVGGRGDRVKVSSTHRDIINNIRKNHPKNTINNH